MKHLTNQSAFLTRLTLGALTLFAATVLFASNSQTALAQGGPDVRNVRPFISFLLDSSGSMERVGECACSTPTCNECLPSCAAAAPQKNRWATVLEALTGSWDNYSCNIENRDTAAYAGQYDERYFMPHVVHMNDGQPIFNNATQNNDGILDVYEDRAKFSLMTFDSMSTLASESMLVPQPDWSTSFRNRSAAVEGMYSYGEARPYQFQGCTSPFMLDNGARSKTAPAGKLVSVGPDGSDHRLINGEIQNTLLEPSMRPFGPTPIAGMLTDLQYYYDNDPDVRQSTTLSPGDVFYACRSRSVILITDGYPNADFRDPPFNCGDLGGVPGDGVGCPYETPETMISNLVNGPVDAVYVVGFNVSDPQAIARLNDMAALGLGLPTALFADDRASLQDALSAIIDQAAPGTTTRTIPAFSSGSGNGQQQVSTGFLPANNPGETWGGVIERRRVECNGLVPEVQQIEDRDRFHLSLNNQATRNLNTIIPSTGATTSRLSSSLGAAGLSARNIPIPTDASNASSSLLTGQVQTALSNVTTNELGPLGNGQAVSDVVDFAYGTSRPTRKLGDIYHSSPVLVGPPESDVADESFNAFRQRPEVADRPEMLYVGTNDGIMHGFVSKTHTFGSGHPTRAGDTITEGTELWGFVPPMVLGKLPEAANSHQWMLDAKPVVRNVFDGRLLGGSPNGNEYRTMLISGLRGGGRAVFAMDVTDPTDPKFMWQFSDSLLGETYGEPATAQILVDINGVVHERGVVIIPGGAGEQLPSTCEVAGIRVPQNVDRTGLSGSTVGTGSSSPRHETERRCWSNVGRSLYIVDAATGVLLKKWGAETFSAPLSGGVSVFNGEQGQTGTRAFVTDADGVIWRLDFSSRNISSWTARAFFDMYYDADPRSGQPAYSPPTITTNPDGEVVVIQATGDIDQLDNPSAYNRVYSVTETASINGAGAFIASSLGARINWEVRLNQGEQVTGPVELFGGKVYFGSFQTATNLVNACEFGSSRIWGVDYLNSDSTGSTIPEAALESSPGSGNFDRSFLDSTVVPSLVNQIVLGVAIAESPVCFDDSAVSVTDPYVGTRMTQRITQTSAPKFELVAQVSGGDSAGVDGASIGELRRELPAPVSFTETQGIVGAIQ